MYKNSSKYMTAIQSVDRIMRARVTINNIVYENELINSIDYSGSDLSGEQFALGSTQENTVRIVFSDIIDTIAPLDQVFVEIGIQRKEFNLEEKNFSNIQIGRMRTGTRLNLWNSTEEVEYTIMGEFYISDHVDVNRNDKITTIECKDKMIFLEDVYESQLEYPADVRNVIVEIANMSGVEIDTVNIEELDAIEVGKLEGYSYRQALGFLAQLLVGYVSFNRKGFLQIKKLTDSEYEVDTDNYYPKGLSKNGIRYHIGGITCNVPSDDDPQELFVGSKFGPQLTIENPIMTQAMLQSIYEILKDLDYYPFDLEWKGNPALETGELMTVYDVEGNKLKVPNLNYQLIYNGGLSATSSADTKSQTDIVPSGRKTLQQQIHATQTKIKETATNLQNAFKDAQDKITGNQGGYIIQRFDEDGKPYEFLVMDTEDINSATNVIRLNQQGIGFSQNGYNGPFGVAITIDGQIVADYITAGTLRADLIQAGFNNIGDGFGVIITQDGLYSVSPHGEYSLVADGGMKFYTKDDVLNGSIESAYSGDRTGVGIFIQPSHGFSVVRNNGSGADNVTVFQVPDDVDEFRLRRPFNAYGWNIFDASSVKTKNEDYQSIFFTTADGHAYLAGDYGVRLGYRTEEGNFELLRINADRTARLFSNLDLQGWELSGVNEFKSTGKMDVSNEVSAHRFNVRGTNQYLLNNSSGGGSYIDTTQVSLGVGTPSSFNNKWVVKSDVTESWNDIDMKGRTITNQSDTRLKVDVVDSDFDALKEVERLRVIEFEWDLSNPANRDKPTGKQFGLQAQSTLFLQTKSPNDESYLSIDLFKQINFNTLTGKRLNEERKKHATEIESLKNEIIFLKENIGV